MNRHAKPPCDIPLAFIGEGAYNLSMERDPVPLPNVFEYMDFRGYLKDVFTVLNTTRGISYRAFARMAGSTSPNYLQLILAGKMAPRPRQLAKLASSLHLSKPEASFLSHLVGFAAGRTLAQKERAFRAAMKAAKHARACILEADQYEYFRQWYHSAVRAVLGYYRMQEGNETYEGIARMLRPPVPAAKVEESIKLLLRLGLIEVNEQGYYCQRDAVLTTGDEVKSLQVVRYQLQTLDLARKALEACPPEERDISTITLNISEHGFHAIKERLRVFRKEAMAIAQGDTEDDRVYQCNLMLFPMATPAKRGGQP